MFRSETYLVDVGADDQIEKVGKEGKEGKETKDYDMESIPSRGTNSMQIIEVVEMVEDWLNEWRGVVCTLNWNTVLRVRQYIHLFI